MMPTLLIDLDGVLVKDKKLNPFEDTVDFIWFLRMHSIPFRILSNNSTRPPEKMVQELRLKGIDVQLYEFVSPLRILPQYLKSLSVKRCLVLGSAPLKEHMEQEGLDLIEGYEVDAVVVAQDREISFQKLKLAVSAIYLKGAKIVPVNMSRMVKDDDGLYFPGAGSVALMLAHACNYKESLPNLGKPSKDFVEYALADLPRDEVYLISDDLYTDLSGARELGLKTVFMTTGKYPREELKRCGFEPDHTFDSLTELKDFLLQKLC